MDCIEQNPNGQKCAYDSKTIQTDSTPIIFLQV